MKKCSICKIEKSNDFFNKDSSKRDGLSVRCSECQKNLGRLHYLNNKDKYKETRIRLREKRRQIMRDAKSKPCKDCNIQYPYWIMQFDHLGDKEFSIGTHGYHYGVDRLLKEIEKCEVVCANCHAHRTWLRSQNDKPTL